MVHVHASDMIPSFAVVAPHRILSPLDGLPTDAAWIFGGTGAWVGGYIAGHEEEKLKLKYVKGC